MNFELITELPLWYILFCVLLAGAYTGILYYKDDSMDEVSVGQKRLMATFRFLSSFVLAFLLLSPLIKTENKDVERPVMAILTDNSASMKASPDSAFLLNDLPAQILKLKAELAQKFDVKEYSFSSDLKESSENDYKGNETNISEAINELKDRYENRNLGAVLLVSDGLYNRGSNPLTDARELKLPVFTLAIGDTNTRRDLAIRDIKHNSEVYLGNAFPMEVTIKASQAAGSKTMIRLFENDKEIQRKEVLIGRSNFIQTINFVAEAREKGIFNYSIRLDDIGGEANLSNNRRDLFIEVKERKIKIVLATAGPHPDVSAIKQVVEQNQGYELEIYTADRFNAIPADKDLLILHGLPSQRYQINSTVNNFKKAGVSILYIISNSTSLSEFNKLETGLIITDYRNLNNEVLPLLNTGFGLFNFSDELKKSLAQMPPLLSPFGSYRNNGSEVALQQQIGSVKTSQPLLLFSHNGDSKIGVLAGEGFWRWRLRDFAMNQNQELSNEFMQKIIQYLSVKEKEGRLKIRVRNSFVEGEEIQFSAELYNASFEMVNDPDVQMDITAKDGKKYPFVFSRTDKAYLLNAGNFPPGIYSYKAVATLGSETLSASGQFTISPGQLEFAETNADHSLLYTISNETGAEMFYPSTFSELKEKMLNDERYHSVSFINKKLEDLVRLKWIFFLIVLMISIEWFLRKRAGAY